MSKKTKTGKKIGRPAKHNWEELKPLMKVLARLGYVKPGVMARALGLPVTSVESYLRRHPTFAEELKKEHAKFTGYILQKALEQVGKGYWPAIQWFLDRNTKYLDENYLQALEDNKVEIEFLEFNMEGKNENNDEES